MKRAGPIVVVLLAATAFTAAAAGRGSSGPTADRSGGQLCRLKTRSDSGRNTVELEPTATTIAAIGELPYPRSLPTSRRTTFQRHVWQVVAQITKYRVETGGVRLELSHHQSDPPAPLSPPPRLSRSTRARRHLTSA